jgi:hypothetical protein
MTVLARSSSNLAANQQPVNGQRVKKRITALRFRRFAMRGF